MPAIKCIDGPLASSDQEKADLLNSYTHCLLAASVLASIKSFIGKLFLIQSYETSSLKKWSNFMCT